MSIMYSIGTSCINRDFVSSVLYISLQSNYVSQGFHSIFQAIDGESLFNEFAGK